MITRLVKLTFQKESVNDFLVFFESIKQQVNTFPGCNGMQLIQDVKNPCVVFTYSQWASESELNKYRNSETFGEVWPTIKPWFSEKPEAWTTAIVFNGFEN